MDRKCPFFFIIIAVLLMFSATATENIPRRPLHFADAKLMRVAQKDDHRAQTRIARAGSTEKQDFAGAAKSGASSITMTCCGCAHSEQALRQTAARLSKCCGTVRLRLGNG
jgi:hypothetical protein